MRDDYKNDWVEASLVKDLNYLKTGVEEYIGKKDYYSTGSIKDDSINSEGSYTHNDRPSRANRAGQIGDILQARMKDTDKAVLINDNLNDQLFSTGFFQIRTDPSTLLPKYLFHYFKSFVFLNQKDSYCSGSTQSALNDKSAKNLIVPISPIPVQRTIVTKLEELFSDLDKGIADLKKAQDQLKIYRLAVLKKAFEGELTKEWREQQTDLPAADELLKQIKKERQKHYEYHLEDWKQAVKAWEEKDKEGKKPGKPSITKTVSPLTPAEIKHLYDLPNHWRWLKLSEVSQEMCLGKMLDKKKNQGDFKPYLANINVRWGEFDLQFVKEMKFLDSENERYNLLKGDLVICEGGEPGRCAVWNSVGEMKIQKALHRVRFFKDYTDSNFVYHFLKFSAFSGTLSKYFTGTTIKHLTGQGLAKVPIPGLSLLEQRKIVREIESRLSVCDNVELSISESLEKAKALRQSILKKAFEGTLLSQEEIAACKAAPDYEPASVLLKKIKAEKKK